MTQEIVIKNIILFARKNGIKIGELEKRIGVSTGYLSRCKHSKSISIGHVLKAAETLGCPIARLFDETIAAREELKYLDEQIENLCSRRREIERSLHA